MRIPFITDACLQASFWWQRVGPRRPVRNKLHKRSYAKTKLCFFPIMQSLPLDLRRITLRSPSHAPRQSMYCAWMRSHLPEACAGLRVKTILAGVAGFAAAAAAAAATAAAAAAAAATSSLGIVVSLILIPTATASVLPQVLALALLAGVPMSYTRLLIPGSVRLEELGALR